jgi:hypothetical protein
MTLARWLWLGIGAGLVMLSALPIARWAGATDPGPTWSPYVTSWAIGLIVVGTLGAIVGRFATALRPRRTRWRLRIPLPVIIVGLAVVTGGAATYAMLGVFAGNPHLVDEMAQLFHARVFASGRLAAPAPEPTEFFLMTHTFLVDSGWVSQYPPGHPALLALGLAFGAEWLVTPLMGAIGVPLIFLVGRGLYGPKTGLIAAACWTLSPWVMFMSGTYMNHVTTTTMVLVAWASIIGPRRPGRGMFLIAGLALAVAAATRPLDAVAGAGPLVLLVVMRGHWRRLAWMVAGGAPIILAVAFVNQRLFGSPFTLGYAALYGEDVGLGFRTDPWGESFTPMVALSNLAVAIRRINIYLYEWPVPALLPITAWALLGRQRRASDIALALGAVAIPVVYFFYWHSGFYPGPRFYYAAAPFLVIGTARAWRWCMWWARRLDNRFVNVHVAVAATTAVTLVWGTVDMLPARINIYREGLRTMKLHPERQLKAAGISQALVIVPESWSSRTIVGLWSRGVPVDLMERGFRRVDTCDLFQFLVEARRTGLPTEQMVAGLEGMVASSSTQPPRLRDAPDPWVRLRPRDSLPEECVRELRRDYSGFTLYGNLGWRNDIGLASGVVFARDLYEHNSELLARYPGWEVWRWAPPTGQPDSTPVLQLIRRGSAGEP